MGIKVPQPPPTHTRVVPASNRGSRKAGQNGLPANQGRPAPSPPAPPKKS